MPLRHHIIICALALAAGLGAGCSPSAPPPAASASGVPTGDAAFLKVTDELLADFFKRNPSAATYLGIHDYDSQLEDASKAAIEAESAALKQFRERIAAIDPARLSLPNQLD